MVVMSHNTVWRWTRGAAALAVVWGLGVGFAQGQATAANQQQAVASST